LLGALDWMSELLAPVLRVRLDEVDPLARRDVAAAHAAIRERIAFLDRDRALDGDVATALRMVADGSVLAAARAAP
jgi:histidine ammonia-lyase